MEFNIKKEKMIEELMQTLAKLYEKTPTSNKVFLMKHLFNMKMEKGGSIVDHLMSLILLLVSYLLWELILMNKLVLS